jgi:hypothetical protein
MEVRYESIEIARAIRVYHRRPGKVPNLFSLQEAPQILSLATVATLGTQSASERTPSKR